jgi:tRNA pseudouridine55 synthase
VNAHGLLIVDKPQGLTSHDIVSQARKLYGTRAVGHAGTLDPMATGVLLLLFGEATKLSSALTSDRKRYVGTVAFGRATDSHDADGATTQESEVPPSLLEGSRLELALEAERQRTLQLPPAVSALKVGGRRAHALVRAGATPVLAERAVTVHSLVLTERASTQIAIEMVVSRGYYVRALARDLGAALGVPAHLAALRRLASGPFELGDAAPWPLAAPISLVSVVEAARRALPSRVLTSDGDRRARLGQPLEANSFETDAPDGAELTAWLSPSGELVALGKATDAGELRVVRGFQPQLTSTSVTAKPL